MCSKQIIVKAWFLVLASILQIKTVRKWNEIIIAAETPVTDIIVMNIFFEWAHIHPYSFTSLDFAVLTPGF